MQWFMDYKRPESKGIYQSYSTISITCPRGVHVHYKYSASKILTRTIWCVRNIAHSWHNFLTMDVLHFNMHTVYIYSILFFLSI